MSRRPCVGGHKNCKEFIVNTEQLNIFLVFPATSRYRDSRSDVHVKKFLCPVARVNYTQLSHLTQVILTNRAIISTYCINLFQIVIDFRFF